MHRQIEISSILLFILLLLPSASHAEWRDDLPEGLHLNGRFFQAGAYSFERPYIDERLFGELNLRLNGRYAISSEWKLEFAWQIDGLYVEDLAMLPDSGSEGVLDLRWPIDDGRNWRASHALARLNLNYRGHGYTLDIGRQRMAWGTTFIMSHMDMFHPVRPGDPFVPEQPGTDGVRLRVPTGPVAGWDILYAWLDGDGSEAAAVKYHGVCGDFESAISAGKINGDNFAAFQTSGDINDIGIRIEAAWHETDTGEPYQIAFESDYAPNNRTYLSGEVLYNGHGAADPLKYDMDKIARGVLYPARWYGGVNCTYNDGGLSTLSVFGIANLTDDSWFADISVLHSLSNSSEIRIGYQHYQGEMMSEYGALPDMIYVISTMYF